MSQPRAIYEVNAPPRSRRARRRPASAEAAGFPGCKAVPMTAAEVGRGDGPRIEYWDAEDGFAWMVREGPTRAHEIPAHGLSALLERVSQARGARIICCGATTFYERGPAGEHIRAMEADQTVFLDADRAWTMPSQPMVLGEDPVPDVVVEVDHTTDVRRRKLREYEKWRFPEVWVEVPDAPHPSRPRSRPSALTIHVLCAETGRYSEAAASRALPGWTAAEIHSALNERQRSAATLQALERVGRALGEREGTVPAEDPLTRRAREDAHEEGRAIGRAEGRAMARNEEIAAAVRHILTQRGIAHSPTLFAAGRMADHSNQRLVAAALACDSEADFLARLSAPHD